MDKLKGILRRALGLQSASLPTEGDDANDSERLLASSSSSDLMACEKTRGSCDCVCHQAPPPRRFTKTRINLFASLFWLLGTLLIILAFRGDSRMPANGIFGWCKWLLLIPQRILSRKQDDLDFPGSEIKTDGVLQRRWCKMVWPSMSSTRSPISTSTRAKSCGTTSPRMSKT